MICKHCGHDEQEHFEVNPGSLRELKLCPTTKFQPDPHQEALKEAKKLDNAVNPEADPTQNG
jgi:hypothetical protein